MPRDLVTIDPAAIRAALDGRTQRWLALHSGVHEVGICRMLHSTPPDRPQRVMRITYERLRAALPALPPPPEPATNGHSNGAGQEVAPGG